MISKKGVCISMALCAAIASVAFAQTASDSVARVLADYAALQSAETDFRKQLSHRLLSSPEVADYQLYISALRDRFYTACAQLARADRADLVGKTPCPPQVPAAPFAAAIDLDTERTRGEQTADLDSELGMALSEFDDMLLREQEQIKAATPATAASTTGAGGDGAQADGDGQRDGDDRAGSSAGSSAGAQAREGTTGEGSGTRASAGAVVTSAGAGGDVPGSGRRGKAGERQAPRGGQPPDTPDGGDDDVVARQLREAAQQETDSELKKRLWEEYRRYKRGTR